MRSGTRPPTIATPVEVKILVAPDKFKGSISALAAAEAIARGIRSVLPDTDCELAPIADGGEGFAEALGTALGGEWVKAQAEDPIGRAIEGRYMWVGRDRTAIVEMSEASGLWRLKKSELDPLRANTFGTGQLMRHAMDRGAQKILVGLGGSATTDGGIGMAAALGYNFLTSDGDDLAPYPGHLLALIRAKNENVPDFPEIVAACDVQNPLTGPRGTANVFAAQKGADAKAIVALEQGLIHLADTLANDLECDYRDVPGAGAAGGIAFGLMSFCGAKIQSGFDLVAETLRLEERIAACDLVITGEGRLDDQTLDGKGPAGIAGLARKHRKPTLAFAGSVADNVGLHSVFDATCPIIDQPVTLDDAMQRGAEFLERAAVRAARLFILSKKL